MTKLDVQKIRDTDDRSLPVFTELDEWMDGIRQRAYEIFAERGFRHGSDLDDWLAAERQVCWPATELLERDNEYEVRVALAGYRAPEISVVANPRELIVKAARQTEKTDSADSEQVRWSDFGRSDVYSRMQFPGPVDVAGVSARFEDGMLKVSAPTRAAEAEKDERQIDITEAA